MPIDMACASSLAAHSPGRRPALQRDEIDLALAGGVQIIPVPTSL